MVADRVANSHSCDASDEFASNLHCIRPSARASASGYAGGSFLLCAQQQRVTTLYLSVQGMRSSSALRGWEKMGGRVIKDAAACVTRTILTCGRSTIAFPPFKALFLNQLATNLASRPRSARSNYRSMILGAVSGGGWNRRPSRRPSVSRSLSISSPPMSTTAAYRMEEDSFAKPIDYVG